MIFGALVLGVPFSMALGWLASIGKSDKCEEQAMFCLFTERSEARLSGMSAGLVIALVVLVVGICLAIANGVARRR